MSDDYNPNSIDATLARIESKLDGHVNETREYRKANDAKHDAILGRVGDLEGDRKKLMGVAVGAGVGAGGIGTVLAKLFGH
jgi:hypothetical protein